MRINENEMRFFQAIYFDGLRIKYIDDSRHSPHKRGIEYHENGGLIAYQSGLTGTEKKFLMIARDFIDKWANVARHSDSAFFILRLGTIKICLFFE